MSERITQVLEKIETSKEILSTMPQNNEKNQEKYLEAVNRIKDEYMIYKVVLLKEMAKRYKREALIKENIDIENHQKRMEELKNIYYLLNPLNTSYEKMDLDKSIYRLSKFYKENLESVNEEILNAIQKFKDCDIKLTVSDFEYTPYVKEYMNVFFSELRKQEINSEKIKNKFDEIYWKCPDLVIQIELNLRYLYLKNKPLIDKFYDRKKQELLSKYELTEQEVIDEYIELKTKLIEEKEIDKKIILDQFLDKKKNIKDYEEDKIKRNYEKIFSSEVLEDEKRFNEGNNNISKFLNTLYEYNNYLKFQFIINNIKEKYLEKENYKNCYNQTQKEIQNKEKELMKLNKSIYKKSLFFGRKKEENKKLQYNELITQIKQLYRDLEKNKVYQKIYTDLNDNSTIKDVLNLANSFYHYLTDCISEKYDDYVIEEIEGEILELREFLENPYNTFINNIKILEEKDIEVMIKDRYKLLDFNITKENIENGERDFLIATLENLKQSQNMKIGGITTKQIQDICNIKDIIEKNNK